MEGVKDNRNIEGCNEKTLISDILKELIKKVMEKTKRY